MMTPTVYLPALDPYALRDPRLIVAAKEPEPRSAPTPQLPRTPLLPTVTLSVTGLRSVRWSTVGVPNIGLSGPFLGSKEGCLGTTQWATRPKCHCRTSLRCEMPINTAEKSRSTLHSVALVRSILMRPAVPPVFGRSALSCAPRCPSPPIYSSLLHHDRGTDPARRRD